MNGFLPLPDEKDDLAGDAIEAFIDAEQWHARATPEQTVDHPEIDRDCKLLYGAILRSENSALPSEELQSLCEVLWRSFVEECGVQRVAGSLETWDSDRRELLEELEEARAHLTWAEKELDRLSDRLESSDRELQARTHEMRDARGLAATLEIGSSERLREIAQSRKQLSARPGRAAAHDTHL